jgi:glycine cleavage system H lipoate-binding protein/TusA-related sulfurtransferase
MQVDFCEFPDDLLYDFDNNVWVRKEKDGHVVLGITSIHSALAGKLTKVNIKPVGSVIAKAQSVATVESLRYFGAVKSPLSCRITAINEALQLKPKLANDYPYSDGWFTKLQPTTMEGEMENLSSPLGAEEKIRSIIHDLHVRCFKAYPDYELWEIGVECAAVLVRLSELIERCAIDEVVHVVSDDPTADIEMVRWSDQSGQAVLESRTEGNLKHFIVRKVRG